MLYHTVHMYYHSMISSIYDHVNIAADMCFHPVLVTVGYIIC